jgi:hypothetical protein
MEDLLSAEAPEKYTTCAKPTFAHKNTIGGTANENV